MKKTKLTRVACGTKKYFSPFCIKGIFATLDYKDLLESKQAIIDAPARVLARSFQEHHLSFQLKKLPHTSFNMDIPCADRNWGTFVFLNFSRQCIWSVPFLSETIYCSADTHLTRWFVDRGNSRIKESREILKSNLLNFTLEYNFWCTRARIQRSEPNPYFRVLGTKRIFITIRYQ